MLRDINLTQELKNLRLNPCNYLHGINVPSNVKAYITFEENHDFLRDGYQLKNNSILRRRKNGQYVAPLHAYLHTVGTSNDKLKVQTQAINYNNDDYVEVEQQDNQTMDLRDDITDSLLILKQLDKIVNPYEEPIYDNGESNANIATIVIHNETLSCDKIDINLAITRKDYEPSYGDSSGITAYLDGVAVARVLFYGSNGLQQNNPKYIAENCKGKTLLIKCGSVTNNDHNGYTLKKYNKKA